MVTWDKVVLCSNILGGAEIFTLERMLARKDTASLYCNGTLMELILADNRYNSIKIYECQCLNRLASQINLLHIRTAARGLAPLLERGEVVLGNLRAASIQIASEFAGRNTAFIHDNTNSLNIKNRVLISIIGIRSRLILFPCRHSSGNLPFRGVFESKLAFEYFSSYKLLTPKPLRTYDTLRIINVGRIEKNKNQLLAVQIASRLASVFSRIELTLLGNPEDENYFRLLENQDIPVNLTLIQREVRRSEVPAALIEHDIVLHTSFIESLPLVLFEANSSEVPFFAIGTGGIPEVLPVEYIIDSDPQTAATQIYRLIGRVVN